jgi:hypothetical protein
VPLGGRAEETRSEALQYLASVWLSLAGQIASYTKMHIPLVRVSTVVGTSSEAACQAAQYLRCVRVG